MTPGNPVDDYREGRVRLRQGQGFFRPDSRPGRDLGVLLARTLQADAPLTVLDLMAGCGVRALRYGVEAAAAAVWANDADLLRLPLLQANLAAVPAALHCQISAMTAQQLLAGCLQRRQRFTLVDLDAFGCPAALLPLALEAVAFDGVLYLASTDGRSPTGHDRRAALRRLGAAARAHSASWEQALRLQIGVVARAAWAMGRGVQPLFSFSEGRTFRTAIRLHRRPGDREEEQLGLLAHCHGCGDQQAQSLLRLRHWSACRCQGAGCGNAPPSSGAALAVSGPLWLGPLQHHPTLLAMREQATSDPAILAPAGRRLLERLAADSGEPPLCWSLADIGRRLGSGPPALPPLLAALRAAGYRAAASGVMAGQLRTDAPWPLLLATAAGLRRAGAAK